MQLTHEEVMHVCRDIGFEIVHEERHSCNYACNDLAMMRTEYKAVCFTARKPLAGGAAGPPAAAPPAPLPGSAAAPPAPRAAECAAES